MTSSPSANSPAHGQMPPAPVPTRASAATELKTVALAQFSLSGFAATSLQSIADAAGYSKSSVLYHFESKDALLEAVLDPAIDRLGVILAAFTRSADARVNRHAFVESFIEAFVDFLLEHRLEVHIFINQGQSLRGTPVIDRANELIIELTASLFADDSTTEERFRFGIALGGAAYTLVAGMTFAGDALGPPDESRVALITVVSELLAPISLPRPSETTDADPAAD